MKGIVKLAFAAGALGMCLVPGASFAKSGLSDYARDLRQAKFDIANDAEAQARIAYVAANLAVSAQEDGETLAIDLDLKEFEASDPAYQASLEGSVLDSGLIAPDDDASEPESDD